MQTAIAQRLSWPALALAHEQFGGYAVDECHSLAVSQFCVQLNSTTEVDRKGLFGRQASGLLRRAKRSFGNPYVNPYYGSYYAPQYCYDYWNYHSRYYW